MGRNYYYNNGVLEPLTSKNQSGIVSGLSPVIPSYISIDAVLCSSATSSYTFSPVSSIPSNDITPPIPPRTTIQHILLSITLYNNV